MHLENRTFDELQVGDSAELKRLCTFDDLLIFANVSGNHNPMHIVDPDGPGPREPVAPSMFIGSLVSAVLGNILPGAGTLYRRQLLDFSDRAHAGDELLSRVRVTGKNEAEGTVTLATEVRRVADDVVIMRGEAVVEAPREKLSYDDEDLPGLLVQRHRHFEALMQLAEDLPPLPMAVVVPEEEKALGGALLAAQRGLIEPVLIGARAKIEALAEAGGCDLSGIEILDEPDHAAAARRGVALVREGRAGGLMKGHLHTDVLLRAAMDRDRGLRAGRRLTHVFVMDVPGLSHPLLVTDAAINISPDLSCKMDIVQNAIEVARAIGIDPPRVAVLSSVETVNPALPSSLDAALLSKMADRGQITGGYVEGPLAMDNAVDMGAARTKGLGESQVAGRAEVLVAPNLDAGNMIAKQLTFIAHAEAAGVVAGATAPIVLTSRADDETARLASCAVAALHHRWLEGGSD
ncbi:MAG: bifunctional enoyl-CoA hydratase/phosphate acetyltransferase [Rhodosalinus sp.]|uniref:bifunctional enoyl-CoA hydratase/phosphate acetyltransferase n=1 Tax=Rhodosalinus sp. TaxID=2047741 RepID=UPI0039789DCD